jgi:curved DNA-binding protein CbpA
VQARVPLPVHGIDVFKLPLSSLEGFVLSRVDGATSLEDISMMIGIEQHKVLGILERLCELGAVELSWRSAEARASKPPLAASAGKSAAPASRRSAKPTTGLLPDQHFTADPPRFAASELEEPAAIAVAVRQRILHAFYSLEGRDLYQVLGVARDADRKAIRSAYFELSKLFHPDAYFGKELGGFKPKLEAVFKRLTESYEVLGKAKKRREYDEYLVVTEQAQKAQRTLDSLEFTEHEIEALRSARKRANEAALTAPAEGAGSAPSAEALRSPRLPRTELVAEAAAVADAPPSRRAPSQEERRARVRERVRQRLKPLISQPPAARSRPPPSTPEQDQQRRRDVIEGLRNSVRASAMVTAPKIQLAGYLAKARNAELAGDVLLAASQLQLALGLEPHNADLIAEYERVSSAVARNLADNHEKQANYEEKTGNWQAAARSWMRVSDGRPQDAESARRAAEALLKASGDLHHAQKYAQKAVGLQAQSAANLTALARVYLAAGLKLNALRELEKAARIAPGDEVVNNLLREAR